MPTSKTEEEKIFNGRRENLIRKFKVRDLRFTANSLSGGEGGSVTLVARTDNAVETWAGEMIHDLSGMTHREKVPLDWCHGNEIDECIGYLDGFSQTDKEIVCTGRVIPLSEGDIASKVLKQLDAGFPLEASISFGGQGLEFEEVGRNSHAQVNGHRFDGPGIIVRKWPLRGVAICPHGADNQTSTSLALSEEEVIVTMLKGEDKMVEEEKAEVKEELTEVKEELKEVIAPPTSPSGKDFMAAFGTNGAIWFAEEKTFEEARDLHIKALEGQVKSLTERIAAADLGDDDSIKFNDGEDGEAKKTVDKLTGTLGPRLATFAAGLKFRK